MLLRRGCTWLTLMTLLLSLSTGELSFYRNALPETSEDVALKELTRYLEAHRLQQRLHRSHLATFLLPMHKKHNNLQQLNQQEERRLVEFIADRKKAQDSLNRKLNAWLVNYYHSPHYHGSIVDQITSQNSGYFYDLGHKYPDYREEKQPDETDNGNHFSKNLKYGRTFDVGKGGAMEEPVENVFYKYIDHNPALNILLHHESGKEAARPASAAAEATEPEFTYKFDNSNLEEKHPFAMTPNDPRYYNNAPFSLDDTNQQDALRTNWREKEAANEKPILIKHEDNIQNVNQKTPNELVDVSKSDSSVEYHPMMVSPWAHDLNNDIYFIAIVAGGSAAAMFALVLISITWCRLQRGVKAAADIEYPAYGVTGPNKDVSPSGDQRLAQSAQMYHFQHQKQQIIAMENRTSATRDPGSLSEAESDEENEEGDYTVYECPGLASTGEMEVKNPMFHDDPTPATPAAQSNNKEEDHI